MKKYLIILLVLISLIAKQSNAMENQNLFDKQINDTLRLQFVRNDIAKTTITWQTLLINTKTEGKLVLDSYTLPKEAGRLGDPIKIAGGEDMIFHHDLANAILIDKSLYVIHNKQGQIFMHEYDLTPGTEFTKSSFYLTKYLAIGALGHGFQYADFLHRHEDLYILVDAGCEMTGMNQRVDWLFRFDMESKKLFSLKFNSIEKKEETLAVKVDEDENHFVTMDLKLERNGGIIRNIIHGILTKSGNARMDIVGYWGALENMKSYIDYSSKIHMRTSGMLFFFYRSEKQVHIIRFHPSDLSNSWFIEDYIETPLSGKAEN